jgi:hypothetical protein
LCWLKKWSIASKALNGEKAMWVSSWIFTKLTIA